MLRGPFSIKTKFSPVSYELRLPQQYQGIHPVFHINKLKPWKSGDHDVSFCTLPKDIEGEEEYEVEEV